MSQGVVTLLRPPTWTLDHVFRGLSLVVVVDGVQDPGNGGAIVRAAEAFGATGVVFLKGSANPYNPKALRASAGSVFRIPLVAGGRRSLVARRRARRSARDFMRRCRAAGARSTLPISVAGARW